MPTRELDHQTFRSQIDAYVAGALDSAEAAAVDAHAAGCPDCAAALADAEKQDALLRDTFAGAQPRPDLEEHLVTRLRLRAEPQKRMWIHPAVRRAAVGVAAVVMLGGFGLVVTSAVERGGLPFAGTARREQAINAGSSLIAEDRNRSHLWYWGEVGGEAASPATSPAYPGYGGDSLARGEVAAIQPPSEMARSFNRFLERGGTSGESDEKMLGESRRGREHFGRRSLVESNRPQSTAAPEAVDKLAGVKAGKDGAEEAKRESGDVDVKVQLHDFGGDAKKYGFIDARAKQPGGVTSLGSVAADAAPSPDMSLQWSAQRNKGGGEGRGYGNVAGGGFGGYAYRAPGGGPDNGRNAQPAPAARSDSVSTLGGANESAPPEAERERQLQMFAKTGREARTGRGDAAANGFVDAFRPEDYVALKKNTETAAEAKSTRGVEAEQLSKEVAAQVENLADQQGQQDQGVGADPGRAPAPEARPVTQPGQPAALESPVIANAGRKIIRNGEMSFEVDSFDSSYLQITKIAGEEGGFVATTDSEKLANGKVRGTVTVRVPPDRLDTLVLKLRGLGDLKSSRLAANDITKQYTDLESQLRASRAMEERLLNIIKTGKGEIKDLVEAEKQLGVYREKIEQVEGEIRYYNNLVSLSTLNVTLTERDIRTASMLSETEQVNMGVEAVDVEKARAAAIAAIDEAKGRIVESDLKKLQAGQFAARVVADVPPDAAGPLIDRMKQIGTVARLEIERKQAAPEGTVAPPAPRGAPGAGPRVERKETRFLISLYNLANVAPRQVTNLNLAAEDVEVAYRSILDQVKSAGGRVVTSQLNRPRPDQTTGTITFEAPAEGADVLLGAVRAAGEVMRLEVSQNPDAQNVTEAKRGFSVQVFSMASVAPRETTSLRLAARGVADAFNKLRESVRTTEGARILSSQLAEQDPANVTGTLDFEVRRGDWATVEAALREAGAIVSRNVSRSADAENTVDTKIRLQVVLVDEAALGAQETVTLQLAVADVPAQYAKLLEAAAGGQARVLQSQLAEQQTGNDVTGTLVFDVRRENRSALDRATGEAGDVVSRSVVRSTDTQNTLDDKVRVSLTLTDADRLPPRETTTLGLEVKDVDRAKDQIQSLAISLGGRVVDSTLSREQTGRVMARVVADVPLGKAMEMVQKARDAGRVQFRRDARDENVPEGKLARARVDVTLANEDLIVEGGQGLGDKIRGGLRTSVTGLLWSVQLIVVGLFLVAPWALIVWFGWKLIRRNRARRKTLVGAAG